jgi:small GTP-binding protein
MGNWIASVFAQLNPKKDFKILMVGLDNAGKTTILYRLRLGDVIESTPTIGFNVEEVNYGKINFKVWDIGGQEKIRKLWYHYFRMSDAVIYVVDSNDTDRVEDAEAEIKGLMEAPDLEGVPLLVFANKQDLPHAIPLNSLASRLKLTDYRTRQWHCQACCAKSGDGLYEGLNWLSKALSAQSK